MYNREESNNKIQLAMRQADKNETHLRERDRIYAAVHQRSERLITAAK